MKLALGLQRSENRYRKAAAEAEKLRAARNAIVLAAIAEGWSHSKIAEATGLSRARVGQIALTRDRTAETR